MTSTPSWTTLDVDGDEPAARARWLERVLVGLDLPAVITELAAIAASSVDLAEVPPEAVRSWLGPDATAVLEQGLDRLPRCKLDELFRRPGLLVGLQELAFTEGGPYWNRLVRQDDAMNVVADRHRDAVLRRLGLPATKPGRNVALPPKLAAAADGGPPDPPGKAWRSSARARLLLFVLAPLATAAAALVAVLPSMAPRQPEGGSGPGAERVVIVKTVVPAAEVGRPESRESPDEPWPVHPWQGIVVPGAGATAPATDVLDKIAGSREWSRRLDEARNLSATQVRAAAERARDAVSAIETLVGSDSGGFGPDGRSLLKSQCRRAKAELDHLQSAISAEAAGDGGVARAKADIVRVLSDVEGTLADACSPAAPAPADPANDGEVPSSKQDP